MSGAPTSRITFQRLAALDPRLSTACDLAALAKCDDIDPGTAWVACVHGPARLASLDLDAPFATGRPLREWCLPDTPPSNAPFAVVFDGDLDVTNDISCLLDADCSLPHLVVLGGLRAGDVVVGGQCLHVTGDAEIRGLFWGDDDANGLHVGGDFDSGALLRTGDYRVDVHGAERTAHVLDAATTATATGPGALRHGCEALAFVFEPGCLVSVDDGQGSAADLLDREAVVQAVRAQRPVLRPAQLVDAFMPLADDIFPDTALSVRNIERLVSAAGLIAPDANASEGCWWGNIDFSLKRRHVDSDGDQRDDHVYATVHKEWDFYLSVAHRPVVGRLSRVLGAMFTASQPTVSKSLALVYRRYDEDGEPGEWNTLTAEAEEGAAWERCNEVWLGVLDYARKAAGQARAGHPLRKLLLERLTPARLQAIAGMPLFRQQYNAWDGGDNLGYWEGEVFVAVRQAGPHGEPAVHRDVAMKFCYETGEEMPGDEEHRCHCAYLVESAATDVDAGKAGADSRLDLSFVQRQGDSFEAIPLHAVDHQARLLRFFDTMQAPMLRRNAECVAQLAAMAQTEAAARLLRDPPFADDLPDEAIFSVQLLEASRRWQEAGAARVELLRTYQRRAEAGELSDEEREQALPDDPRGPDAALAMAFARTVSRLGDAGLQQRLRRLFSFAPDAMGEQISQHGQVIGPVFWLGPRRAVVGVGSADGESQQWMEIDGVVQRPLPLLRGLGRSNDGRCFARSDGNCVTTHFGGDGEEIMRFALPAAAGAANACEELIPFNDGRRVLVRDRTGIYLLCANAVEHLYPPREGEGAEADGRAPSMLHMALAPDERLLAVGHQDSGHALLDLEGPVAGRLLRASRQPPRIRTTQCSAPMAAACFSTPATSTTASPCSCRSRQPRRRRRSWTTAGVCMPAPARPISC